MGLACGAAPELIGDSCGRPPGHLQGAETGKRCYAFERVAPARPIDVVEQSLEGR